MTTLQQQLSQWRHQLHQIPEFGFEEKTTADFIANKLSSFGLEVHSSVGGTGVVAVLKRGQSQRSIGLRADLDALKIQEQNQFDYKSKHEGMMHACGHDGHMTMLLGAAYVLSQDESFDGTVYFIFQPAEEHGLGALAMMDDGLFNRWPIDEVYAIHNLPGIEAGHFALCPGAILASESAFKMEIIGKGGHAAMPHLGSDPIVIGAQLIMALQTITSRQLSAIEQQAVISVTEVITNGGINILPSQVTLHGDVRCFSQCTREKIKTTMEQMLKGLCEAAGMEHRFHFNNSFPEMINTATQVKHAADAATNAVGADQVNANTKPFTISDDFAFMLQHKPGCYILLGNGTDTIHGRALHTSCYDFNDELLSTGAYFWQALVHQVLNATNLSLSRHALLQ